MKKTTILFFPLVLLLFFLSGVSAADTPSREGSPQLREDVVLDAVPVRVKALKDGKTVDALEKLPEEMGAASQAVIFRIHRVLRGELQKVKMPSLSVWDQAKSAAEDKNVLKLVTMDFKRPEEDQEKEWFSMAVADPWASFGLRENEDAPEHHYKISLARVQKNPESFVLVKSQKL